jgi:hypothetical protein
MAVDNSKNTNAGEYVIEGYDIASLTNTFILQHSGALMSTDIRGYFELQPQDIEIDTATFLSTAGGLLTARVEIKQASGRIVLTCTCLAPKKKLCEHQVQVLYNLVNRDELKAFFDTAQRYAAIRQIAREYGLESENDLDAHFMVEYSNKTLQVKPRKPELLPVTKQSLIYLNEHLIPKLGVPLPPAPVQKENTKMVVVLGQQRFYDHLNIELIEAEVTKGGKLKNPLTSLNPLDLVWNIEKGEELKFFTGISRFQNNYNANKSAADTEALKAIVSNPLQMETYYHDTSASASIKATSIKPIALSTLVPDIRVSVFLKDGYYEISGQLVIQDKGYDLHSLHVKFGYFIHLLQTFYLLSDTNLLRVIEFFKQHHNRILIHQSKFEEFRENILAKLEHKVQISYAYLKPATKKQMVQHGFNQPIEPIIYLSDSEDWVLLTPVMKYGDMEIPVLSKKQVYATDLQGKAFTIPRNEEAELQLIMRIIEQHPYFMEQYEQDSGLEHHCFWLHRSRFMEEGWFLDAFEGWKKHNIAVLGFNELKGNTLNPNKAKVSVIVRSGVDWFDTHLDVYYGKHKVSLKYLQKAIRNNSKYVQLGDGTQGILPAEWLEKFAAYFSAGEVTDDTIRTPKVNFTSIAELYEQEVLDPEVKEQLAYYQAKLEQFESIEKVNVPAGLQASLRDYQKQGLNWLNFLDDFNFGGILADDMGLGKTVQIIAFILLQRQKVEHNTNLIVVPTTLIFNWQDELRKFAPSIRVKTLYGAERLKGTRELDEYEVVLTSYGTLLSDVRYLKEYYFNYIFLDESQAIKNPESQRYKAVRLLQSRNKIALTGTPIENNTFDIYSQLSFACPGLLGSKQQFKEQYSMPIDKFKDGKRARALQKKISPFILRRTKEQVATELPDKTEMLIYCEMGEKQRKVYNAYAKEYRDFLLQKPEDELSRHSMHVLQGLTRLRQICNSPALLADDTFYGGESAKIEVLMEQIESKAPNHKILVFSQFVGMLELIKEELESRGIAYEYLTGQTRNRAGKVESFQNNAEVRVFLISLKAGGTGLNLTEADYVYMVDPWWNPAVENQAIDRTHRIGQKRNVVAVRLICPETIEDKMIQLQATKMELAQDLIKTDTAVLKNLSKAQLLDLFS